MEICQALNEMTREKLMEEARKLKIEISIQCAPRKLREYREFLSNFLEKSSRNFSLFSRFRAPVIKFLETKHVCARAKKRIA